MTFLNRKTELRLHEFDAVFGETRQQERIENTVKAIDVEVGMICDLEGDKYADPDSTNSLLKHSYMNVVGTEVEDRNCVVIYFEDFDGVGFPLNHELKLMPTVEQS